MPSPMPELEWITTEELATEILRRGDAGIVINVTRLVSNKDSMSIYKRGSLEQTLVILSAAATELIREEM